MKAEIIKDTEDHITEAAVATSATKFVPPGSVLMVMRSGILRHTFPVAVNTDRVTVNQDLRALIPAEGINPRYVAHYLRGIQRQVLDSCSKDGTTVQSIEFSALERVRVPIAPTAEQRRIMARIDELFAEIADGQAALERARQGLDVWHRALLKAAVTGELTRDWREANRPAESGAELLARIRTEREIGHSGFRLPKARGGMAGGLSGQFHVPEGWAWATIGDIALAVDYGTSEKCGTDPVGVPVSIGESFGQFVPGIGTISEEVAQPGEEIVNGLDNDRRAIAVLNLSRVDLGADQEATRIGDDMALAPLDLFAGVIPARAAALGGLDGLTVDDPGRGTGFATRGFAGFHQQFEVDPLQNAVVAPA